MNNKYVKEIIIFFSIWIMFIIIYILRPIMPDWDWYNYRAYNCWAFLNGRLPIDFFASNLRTCINPLINLPEYFLMVKVKNFYLATILGTINISILMFFLYKMIDFLFAQQGNLFKIILFLFSFIYLINSPMFLKLSIIGGSSDVIIAMLCLAGLYYLMKNLFIIPDKKRNLFIFICGCLFGAAAGLKYTAIVSFITVCLIFIIFRKKTFRPYYTLMLFLLGGFISFFITGGIWMIYCYNIYHNPVFPYFNDIFHSEYADFVRVHNSDYEHILPKNLFEYVFYSFLKYENEYKVFGYDNRAYDLRWGISYICVVFLSTGCFISKYLKKGEQQEYFPNLISNNSFYLLLCFITFSYLINTAVFGTYRYIMASYCLFGIIVYLFSEALFCNIKFKKFIIFCFCVLITLFVYLKSGNGYIDLVFNFGETITKKEVLSSPVFKNKNLEFKNDSKVFILNNGTAIGAVGQNKNTQYIGFSLDRENYDILDKYKEFYLLGAYFVPSNYIAGLNKKIILSNDFVHIIYSEDTDPNIVLRILEKYNKEREIPRKISNCIPADIAYYGISANYMNIVKCDFN